MYPILFHLRRGGSDRWHVLSFRIFKYAGFGWLDGGYWGFVTPICDDALVSEKNPYENYQGTL